MADQERKTPVDGSEQSQNAMSPSQQAASPSSLSSNQRADSDDTPKSPTVQSTTTSSPPQQAPEQAADQQQHEGTPEPPAMSEAVRTLKEAFPETDVEVIEAILESQSNSVERSFEVLLGMSDPNYKPEVIPRPQPTDNTQDDIPPPAMPPRPTGDRQATQAPYGYWQQPEQQPQHQQQPQEPRSVEEQMRMDEEFARQLALQDERDRVNQYRQRQQQQQQQQEDDQPLFNFQEDLPVIKEKVIEAGNAAKKKVMDLYNQFKASREQQGVQGQSSSIPTTNAQYRGLPSDEGDELLAGDVSALRLSDNDVYAQTRPARGQPQSGVIHVNPPLSGQNKNLSVDEQIRADEELARRLAEEDQFWEASRETTAPQMPPRRTPTPGSPITGTELEEGESVTLSAMPSTQTPPPQKKPEERAEERRSYVIRDEDDSDDDDLVDVDTEVDLKKEEKPNEKQTTSPH
ncbi:hypothetical protein BJV82DRAFT_600309 [Fennellomyces sp. T-0311]|nr:hypothetical protein BJV82DRAFT_600309 [Fennellomyces sp. T-0311]